MGAIVCITVASSPVGIFSANQPSMASPWISCRTVLCCSESDGADGFERDAGTVGLEPDASSSTFNGRNLVAPGCLEGPGAPELLSYLGGLVIESGILLDS